jgi:hypothetical protein
MIVIDTLELILLDRLEADIPSALRQSRISELAPVTSLKWPVIGRIWNISAIVDLEACFPTY